MQAPQRPTVDEGWDRAALPLEQALFRLAATRNTQPYHALAFLLIVAGILVSSRRPAA